MHSTQTQQRLPQAKPPARLRRSEVIAAMSAALDLTEGQPAGHAARSCVIGMKLASELGLEDRDRVDLYYALLLKDLGCSSNAAKMTYLFGSDDRTVKRNVKLINWTKLRDSVQFAWREAKPGARSWERILHVAAMALRGPAASRALIKTRCERGAAISKELGFSDATAQAIEQLDEHWDGRGHPKGLRGEEISPLARILGLAQTLEVFAREQGVADAMEIARRRRGNWFEPKLVNALLKTEHNQQFWRDVFSNDPNEVAAALAPEEESRDVSEDEIDRIALAFSHVVDAKSPWTFQHSTRVAEISLGIAEFSGYDASRLRSLRRAALLHDIGKLGVSNLILDKPGRPTEQEFVEIRRHPELSERILSHVGCFAPLAPTAGSHHERLDGQGYHRGIPSDMLWQDVRIITVADIFEALTAARPYREGMSHERALEILSNDMGNGVCPEALGHLKGWLGRNDVESRVESQFQALDQLLAELDECPDGACGVSPQ